MFTFQHNIFLTKSDTDSQTRQTIIIMMMMVIHDHNLAHVYTDTPTTMPAGTTVRPVRPVRPVRGEQRIAELKKSNLGKYFVTSYT